MNSQNPKDILAAAQNKPLLSIIPQAAMIGLAEAMADGANKYGRYNWRKNDIVLTTYISAMMRHLVALADGEDCARDSKLHHLKHVMAGAAIVLDAIEYRVIVDDRPGAQDDAKEAAQDGDNWDRPPLKLHGVEETPIEGTPWGIPAPSPADDGRHTPFVPFDHDPCCFIHRRGDCDCPENPANNPAAPSKLDFPKFPTHGEIYCPIGSKQRWRYEGNGQWVNLAAFTEKGQPVGKYEELSLDD